MSEIFIRFAQLIRHDTRLSPLARLIYCDFVDLCTKEGALLISNRYLSKIFNVEEISIVLALAELENLSIIRFEQLDKTTPVYEPNMLKNKRVKEKIIKDKMHRIIYLNKDSETIFGINKNDLFETWK